MEEDMGTIVLDGKVYILKDLSIEELRELDKKLKDEEIKTKEEIKRKLGNK